MEATYYCVWAAKRGSSWACAHARLGMTQILSLGELVRLKNDIDYMRLEQSRDLANYSPIIMTATHLALAHATSGVLLSAICQAAVTCGGEIYSAFGSMDIRRAQKEGHFVDPSALGGAARLALRNTRISPAVAHALGSIVDLEVALSRDLVEGFDVVDRFGFYLHAPDYFVGFRALTGEIVELAAAIVRNLSASRGPWFRLGMGGAHVGGYSETPSGLTQPGYGSLQLTESTQNSQSYDEDWD